MDLDATRSTVMSQFIIFFPPDCFFAFQRGSRKCLVDLASTSISVGVMR